jgi:hypothetical protein
VDEVSQEPFPPAGVDLDRPTIARVYDYLLGGTTNWAIDREFGEDLLGTFPILGQVAKANRQFLFRAVRHLMRQGVRQFIDLGAGVPTMDHTHAVADGLDPGTARVVYVDNEPVAVAHSQMLLEENGDSSRHVAINGDIRAPERLWKQVEDTGIIDFDQPVAVLMIAVLHVQQQDENNVDMGAEIVARYRELLRSGSYLTISHLTDEGVPPEFGERLKKLKQLYDSTSSPVIWRSQQQIKDLFGDFEIIEPGLTWTPLWHPEEVGSIITGVSFNRPNESAIFAGVGRKP